MWIHLSVKQARLICSFVSEHRAKLCALPYQGDETADEEIVKQMEADDKIIRKIHRKIDQKRAEQTAPKEG